MTGPSQRRVFCASYHHPWVAHSANSPSGLAVHQTWCHSPKSFSNGFLLYITKAGEESAFLIRVVLRQ